MGFEVVPAAFLPYAKAPRCYTALKVSSGAHNCSVILTRWCSHPLRDEGLVGLQMLPSPWLAMGFFSTSLRMLFHGRGSSSYFCRVFLLLACFRHGGQKVPLGVRFCTKPTRTVLDRGIPCVAWSMLDLFLGNPEAARPTNNQTKIVSYATRPHTLTVLVEHIQAIQRWAFTINKMRRGSNTLKPKG